MKVSEWELVEAKERLLKQVKPDSVIYCIIDHVSPDGVSKHLKMYVLVTDDKSTYMQPITNDARKILLLNRSMARGHYGCALVSGGGLDLASEAVSNLAYALFGNEHMLKCRIL